MEIEIMECFRDAEGQEILLYAFPPRRGVRLWVTNFGAAIYRLQVENRAGTATDVALTCASLRAFTENVYFFGATVGRVSNRMRGGRFVLNGETFQLSRNEGSNHLHGGWKGLDRRVWSGSIQGSEVVFTYVSPDGEEGYPGTMALEVRYAVTEDGMVKITHQAVTDRDTILSLTNHTYFSLGGAGRKKVYDQRLWVDSAFYVESDEALLPTGQVLRVDGTPFDFQEPMAVGRNIQSDFPAVARNHGYDVTLIRRSRGFGRAAVLADAETGIELSVYTDYPAVHLYTGNFVEHAPGLDGAVYERHESVCLEAQSCPGANEFPQLGDICLRAGERYRHIIGYQFSLR